MGCVCGIGGDGDEVGEGADGIEGAFEGGVRRDGGLKTQSVWGGRKVSVSNAVA